MKIPSGNLQWYNETSLELCIFPSHWTSCPGIHEGTSLSSTEIVHYCKREIQQLIGPEQTLYDDWSYVVCPGLDSLTWGRTMMFSHLKYTLTDWPEGKVEVSHGHDESSVNDGTLHVTMFGQIYRLSAGQFVQVRNQQDVVFL